MPAQVNPQTSIFSNAFSPIEARTIPANQQKSVNRIRSMARELDRAMQEECVNHPEFYNLSVQHLWEGIQCCELGITAPAASTETRTGAAGATGKTGVA